MGIVAVVLSTGSQTDIGADYATRVIEFRPASMTRSTPMGWISPS